MDHYTEEQLDALARKGAGDADPHVRMCSLCGERYSFLARFHSALQEEAGIPRDPRIKLFTAKLTKKPVLVLRLYTPEQNLHDAGIDENIVVLAAQATDSATDRYVPQATFASEQDHVVLRVVRDSQEKCFRLHLLTLDPRQSQRAKIEIGALNGDRISTETDDAGIATVQSGVDIEWTRALIAIEPQTPSE